MYVLKPLLIDANENGDTWINQLVSFKAHLLRFGSLLTFISVPQTISMNDSKKCRKTSIFNKLNEFKHGPIKDKMPRVY